MTKSWLISLIMGCLLISLPARAQTFEDGYQSYVRNQFPVAELQFKNALRKATVDEDKSVLLKFIGICQYMHGDKNKAQQSFTQSLGFDRSITIEAEDVLDPSVITFFNGIKSRLGPEVKKKPKAIAQTEPKPSSKAPVSSQNQSNFSPTPKKSKSKKIAKDREKDRERAKGSDSIMGLADSNVVVDDKNKRLSFTQFLPFGFPQYHHDSYWLGGGFAALQIFSLYSMVDADKTIKDRESLNTLVANKEGLTDEQREAFYQENNSFIKKVKSQKNLALAGFVTLWGVSIAESFLFHNNSSKGMAEPNAPQQSIRPIVQANSKGGSFGLSWQTQLK